MFDKNYYCLVAGLREYSLDADTKGFNARAIIEEILEGVSARDARCVRLLYGYYDCENLVNFRKGRTAHNPLGNLSREEIEEQTKNPDRLPARMATVVRSYSAIVDEDADNEDGIDTDRSFENALFSAYYDEWRPLQKPFPAPVGRFRPQPAQHLCRRRSPRYGTFGRAVCRGRG